MLRKIKNSKFLLVHLILLVCVCLFPLYRMVTSALPQIFSGCFLHDRLFLYCPMCGGTRAVNALLHLDILSALRYNAIVAITLPTLLAVDVVLWIRFFQKKEPLIRYVHWVWIVFSVALVLFFLLRNYLMIVHGVDTIGDLVAFWDVLMGR